MNVGVFWQNGSKGYKYYLLWQEPEIVPEKPPSFGF